MMKEIYTLLIELEDSPCNDWNAFPFWKRTVEITAATALDDLHTCIQNVIDFDDDHLYEFYTAKKVRSKKQRQFTSEGVTEEEDRAFWQENFPDKEYDTTLSWVKTPWIREELLDTPLNQLFPLPTGHYLFYLFDYGDDWRFKIRKTNRKQQFALEGVAYPRVVEGEGENPPQYPIWE
jgi:hypothetical protein